MRLCLIQDFWPEGALYVGNDLSLLRLTKLDIALWSYMRYFC